MKCRFFFHWPNPIKYFSLWIRFKRFEISILKIQEKIAFKRIIWINQFSEFIYRMFQTIDQQKHSNWKYFDLLSSTHFTLWINNSVKVKCVDLHQIKDNLIDFILRNFYHLFLFTFSQWAGLFAHVVVRLSVSDQPQLGVGPWTLRYVDLKWRPLLHGEYPPPGSHRPRQVSQTQELILLYFFFFIHYFLCSFQRNSSTVCPASH